MPWDGCELFVAELADDGTLGDAGARRRPRRRGVDLAAGVEPGRRPRVRERSERLVEPRAHPRRRAHRRCIRPRRSSDTRPGSSAAARSPSSTTDASSAPTSETDAPRSRVLDPDSGGLEPLDLPHDALVEHAVPRGRGLDRASSSRAPRRSRHSSSLLDVPSRETTVLRTSLDVPVDASYFSVPRAIEFPTEGGLTRPRALLPARRTPTSLRRTASVRRSSS